MTTAIWDTVISEALVFDGTGGEPQHIDIALKDGKIVAKGLSLPREQATDVIDGEGQWLMPGLLDIHTVVHHVEDDLEDNVDDLRAARASDDHENAPLAQDDGGRHRRERSLAPGDCIGFSLDKAVEIGYTRFGSEIVHLVVEQDSGARNGDLAAVGQVQGVGV